MPFHHSQLIASALLAGLVALPGAALAQTADPAPPPSAEEQTGQTPEAEPQAQMDEQPGAQTETETEESTDEQAGEQAGTEMPTDEQLESFAAATIDIVQIQETAQKDMQEAVENAGLTVDEYNRIAQLAQTDRQVDEALQKIIKDRLGG